MTTEEVMRLLNEAKTEEEMLALAEKLGVCNAFFRAGSARDLDKRPLTPEEEAEIKSAGKDAGATTEPKP